MTISDLLFATPWYLLALLIGGGAFVWYTGNSRSNKKVQIAGLGVFSVGLVLLVLSAVVKTDKEKVETDTRAIIADVGAGNWEHLKPLLAPQTSLEPLYHGRDALIGGAQRTADSIGLKSVSVTSMQVTQNDTEITADVTVLSTQDSTMDRPIPTSWRFDWSDRGNGFQLERIEALGGSQFSASEIESHFRK